MVEEFGRRGRGSGYWCRGRERSHKQRRRMEGEEMGKERRGEGRREKEKREPTF
jgi:hypothetical protein